MTKTCKNCGTVAADNNLFCKNCGTKFDEEVVSINNQTNVHTIPQSNDNKNLIIVLVVVIVAAALILGGLVMAGSFNNSASNQVVNNIDNSNANTASTGSSSSSGLTILGGSFSTGSSLSAKTYCTINVGSEHAGESVKISVLYSRDGSTLNNGNIVSKTVGSDGTVKVASAYGFKYYPDYAQITLYYGDGSVADTQNVNLKATSGKQTF